MTAFNKQAREEKARESFEQWAEQSGALPWGILKKHRNQDGSYPGPHYTYMWHAWNACHEALLDELEAAERLITEWEQRELSNKRQLVINELCESGEPFWEIDDYMKKWDAEHPREAAATNEELIAMGDWVMREQLEDGTRAIKTLNRRIAELEARDETKFVKCWSCKHDIEVLAIVDCDGYCPRCASPIDLDDEPYAGIGVKGE